MLKTRSVALVAVITLLVSVSLVLAQPRPMAEDIFTPLSRGYDFMSQGKYVLAKAEFEKVIKADRYNPYANNNLAAIAEREGHPQVALGYLQTAMEKVDQYPYRVVSQVCFPGGLCTAVKPVKQYFATTGTSIAAVIGDNITKLSKKQKK
jgi:tetratricopeptide (TPR) repeat protein